MKFAEWAKAYVALAGLVANGFLAEANLPDGWEWPIRVVALVAAAFAVWRVPNEPAVPPAVPYIHEGPGTLQ